MQFSRAIPEVLCCLCFILWGLAHGMLESGGALFRAPLVHWSSRCRNHSLGRACKIVSPILGFCDSGLPTWMLPLRVSGWFDRAAELTEHLRRAQLRPIHTWHKSGA